MSFVSIVEKFIGSGNFEPSLAEQGVREVIDILPPMYLMRYAPTPVDLIDGAAEWRFDTTSSVDTHAVGGLEDKRILKVLRNDGRQWRECNEVDYMSYSQAKNSESIYESTEYSPVYNIDMENGYPALKVHPQTTGSAGAADSGRVIYVPYPNFHSEDAYEYVDPEGEISGFLDLGFSMDGMNIMALKAAIYITQNLISDAVQDDEDSELLSMLNAQQTSLNSQYEMDMKRLLGSTAE